MNGCEIFEAEFFDPVSAIAQTDFLHAYLRNPSSSPKANCIRLPTRSIRRAFYITILACAKAEPIATLTGELSPSVPRCNAKGLHS
jgi:hypothetical protein